MGEDVSVQFVLILCVLETEMLDRRKPWKF